MNEELISLTTQLQSCMDASGQRIFLCFGTLLSWVRDRVFNTNSDIDIGVIGDANAALTAFSSCFVPTHIVRDDITNDVYQCGMKNEHCGCVIDIFFWRRKSGMYYHTFDEQHQYPTNGKLRSYTFKGIPCECFDAPASAIDLYHNDIRYSGSMTNMGTWKKTVPQIPEEGIELPLPYNYGHCLDYWYPDWTTRRTQFGTSECAHKFSVQSCKNIGWEL